MYFAKLLPVNGELKVGDLTFWNDDEGFHAKKFVTVNESFISHAKASGWKKFKLFVCQDQIVLGSIVHSDHLVLENNGYGLADTNSKVIDYNHVEDALAVIGEISEDAIWVKPGDILLEKDMRIASKYKEENRSKIEMDFESCRVLNALTPAAILEKGFIKIKGPCGHFH